MQRNGKTMLLALATFAALSAAPAFAETLQGSGSADGRGIVVGQGEASGTGRVFWRGNDGRIRSRAGTGTVDGRGIAIGRGQFQGRGAVFGRGNVHGQGRARGRR